MPKTFAYLEQYFHNLKGYNKIGDNTFPNLMAILTGQNISQAYENCEGKVKDKCDMIWSTFRELGYTTAYAEDQLGIFDFYRPGFGNPPTDYYYNTYLIAAQELGTILRYGMTYCAGPETSGERVFNAVQDFSITFKSMPTFGFFWVNSFSHDNINMPSAMDEKVMMFLNNTSFRSSLEDTVTVFLSDHGFRFGNFRYTNTGWLEERLPFIYMYIPDSFKKIFRKKYENFVVNTQRLTTPFDIYCTFQEILEISNSSYTAKNSQGCPSCHSLLKIIRENRTCKEAAIDQHWCTCTGYTQVSTKDDLIRQIALYVVKEINNLVKSFAEGRDCSTFHLKVILTARMSDEYLSEKNETFRYILVIAETNPNAKFEATVAVPTTSIHNDFKLAGDISRVNSYKGYSDCVENVILKKYCFCNNLLS